MKRNLLLVYIFVSILNAYPADLKFYNINNLYNLSMRETYSVCQDKNGFIWSSSKTGVLRIAGGNYKIYQLPKITANYISLNLTYINSSLIAYTNNGQIFLYDELFDRFKLLIDLRKLLNNNYIGITRIIVDSEKTVWISTNSGLYIYKNEKITQLNLESNIVNYIEEKFANQLFIATTKGISIIDKNTLKRKSVFQIRNNIHITTLLYDKNSDRLWIGTFSNGLFYYDIKTKQFSKATIKNFPNQPVLTIKKNYDSTLLIGVDGQGMWKLSNDGNTILNVYKGDDNNPFSISGDGVYDILCDNQKRIWVATYSGGLCFCEQDLSSIVHITHNINNVNSLINNNVNKILEDSKGDIWFATNNGISRWRVTSNKWDTYYQNKKEQAQVFLSLCEDSKGRIWAGSYSSGYYVLDRNTGKELIHYFQKNNMNPTGKFIYDIFKDKDNDIWIGGLQDVICYLSKEGRFRTYAPQPVRFFMELSSSKMLIFCTYGLICLDKTNGKSNYLGEYFAQDALAIGDNIWIGTNGNGLICYNYKKRTILKITTESGLPSNYVNSVMFDNGFLWLGTENGLCRINPTDNKVYGCISLSPLSNISFNANACIKLKNGNLLWGTNKGALMFSSNTLHQDQLNGRIYIQDMYISGRSIREYPKLLDGVPVDKKSNISMKYNQNTFTIEVLPIDINSQEAKISWKMEGVDKNWNFPSTNHIINYSNIPSGTFLLKIRMYDNSLTHIVDERLLRIHVSPPFWATWWFYLVIFCTITYIIYISLRYYVNYLKQQHAEDKMNFFTNTAHDIRTSLTLITAPIEELNKAPELSEKSRHYLDITTRQSKNLLQIANQLLEFQKVDKGKEQLILTEVDIVKLVFQRIQMHKTSANKKNIELIFTSNAEVYVSAVDEIKIERVIDNLILNAIKYSYNDSKVEISLTCNDIKWRFSIRDYGLGISSNDQKKLFQEFYRGDNATNSKMIGSGIGLLLVEKYVSMHRGNVFFNSKEYEGSLFEVVIPHNTVPVVLPMVDDIPNNYIEKVDYTEEDNFNKKSTHLLIVEDNDELQDFLKYSFQEQYKISTATNGTQAWTLIQRESPDLIISDIMMPDMNGLELCKLIKSSFETSHIPVILLTALSEKADQLIGLGLGADDYITKPFDMTILSQRIKSIIKNREIVRDKALRFIDQSDNEQVIFTNELNDQFVKKAMEVMHANLDNTDFGKNEFASAMNVSPSLLYKKLKSLTGQSPVDLIKTTRLNRALELLQSHKYTITQVSELCGFSSSSYFGSVFKKHFGKLPTEI
ncbi:MAG: two-component regulator propeller domain-containing protein [Bacteroidota bacterium]|nr:two-component regulator propeller domain-containing protein [Bacteroidota bacterium]